MISVFVVDDEKVIATTLGIILRKSGYDTTVFFRAGDALAAAERNPPALVISDVAMPGMTGIELAQRLLQASPTSRVILFSGHAAAVNHPFHIPGMAKPLIILSKPVHPDLLLKEVRSYLGACG